MWCTIAMFIYLQNFEMSDDNLKYNLRILFNYKSNEKTSLSNNNIFPATHTQSEHAA